MNSLFCGAVLISSAIVLSASPPANDNFANRVVLTGNSNAFMGTLAQATLETDELGDWSGAPDGGSVWWSWNAEESLPVTLQILDMSIYSHAHDHIIVWQPVDAANPFPSWTNLTTTAVVIAQMDLESLVMPTSLVFTSTPGATYEIQLVGDDAADVAMRLIATT